MKKFILCFLTILSIILPQSSFASRSCEHVFQDADIVTIQTRAPNELDMQKVDALFRSTNTDNINDAFSILTSRYSSRDDDKGVSPHFFDLLWFLLEMGADINIKIDFLNTPLADASFYGRTDLVKFLLDRGANPNIGNGKSALNEAFRGLERLARQDDRRNIYYEIIEMLLNRNASQYAGETMFYPIFRAIEMVDIRAIELLIPTLNLEIRSESSWSTGDTPLIEAIRRTRYEKDSLVMVKMLLDAGANPVNRDTKSFTPAAHAEANEFYEVKRLIETYIVLYKYGEFTPTHR